MQTTANISLVLTDRSSFERFADSQPAISYGEFYQRLASKLVKGIHARQALGDLAERLVVLAEHAHAFRQMDALEQVSQFLVKWPLPRQYKAIGHYYQALCLQRFGRGDSERAASLLECVVEVAPPKYRARGMISLGANSRNQGDNRTALSRYRDAGCFVSKCGLLDPYVALHTQKMVAVIGSEEGNHSGALVLLENLFPLANSMRSSHPQVYHDYLNSLAVELCEVGRLEEASNISQIVLASLHARAYPEWRETREEIELRGLRASRSTVAVSQGRSEAKNLQSTLRRRAADTTVPQSNFEAKNVIPLPVPDRAENLAAAETSSKGEPAHVLRMQEWTERMHKRLGHDLEGGRSRPTSERERRARLMELSNLDPGEMMMRVMTSVADEVSDDQLFRALIILEGLEPDENQGA